MGDRERIVGSQPVCTRFNSALPGRGGSCRFLRWRSLLDWPGVEATDAATHPTVHRTALHNKGLSCSQCNVLSPYLFLFVAIIITIVLFIASHAYLFWFWLIKFLYAVLSWILFNDIDEALRKILVWFLNQLCTFLSIWWVRNILHSYYLYWE